MEQQSSFADSGVLAIIELLRANNSVNYKRDTLIEQKNNELLKQVLYYTYNPFYQFYIRKIPEYQPETSPIITLSEAFKGLDSLRSREKTGHAGIALLTSILSHLPVNDAKVVELIIGKDIKSGVSTGILNKVFGDGFIFEYPIMLCTPKNEKTIAKIEFPAISQLKEDGMRVNAIVKEGKVEYRSRQGSFIEFETNMSNEFLTLATAMGRVETGIVFDGELLCAEKDGKHLDRKIGNGIINKAIKGTITQEESALIVAHLWDAIPYEAFIQGFDITGYQQRWTTLYETFSRITAQQIALVESRVVNNIEEAYAHYEELRKTGMEGTILKNLDSPWENKRSTHQIKLKAELTATLQVIDWQEGTGKYAGMMGALLCKTSDNKLVVSVGSGFSDEQRKTLTKENTVGTCIEILYNSVITSKDGKTMPSLFLPRFVEIRTDKMIADTFDHLVAQDKG